MTRAKKSFQKKKKKPPKDSYFFFLKALYGLKQAGLIFYNKISKLLTDFGYKKSVTDSSLFVLDNSNDNVNMVGLLTDDLLLRSYGRRKAKKAYKVANGT